MKCNQNYTCYIWNTIMIQNNIYKIHNEVEYTYGLYASLDVEMLQRD